MKKLAVISCAFLLLGGSVCLAQTKAIKLDAKAQKLIGQWKWKQVVTIKSNKERIVQTEYMPGIKMTHEMKIFKDFTLVATEKTPKKDVISKYTWEVKGDTLITYDKDRVFFQTYKFENKTLYLTWIRIEGSNYRDYSKQPAKTIEEYIKK
jgi:hypothetical protein